MAGQPLLTDRAEFEKTVRSVPTSHHRDDRHERHENSCRDGDSKGIDHGVITIRLSAGGRK